MICYWKNKSLDSASSLGIPSIRNTQLMVPLYFLFRFNFLFCACKYWDWSNICYHLPSKYFKLFKKNTLLESWKILLIDMTNYKVCLCFIVYKICIQYTWHVLLPSEFVTRWKFSRITGLSTPKCYRSWVKGSPGVLHEWICCAYKGFTTFGYNMKKIKLEWILNTNMFVLYCRLYCWNIE